ncbi:hypothetical protein GMB86_07100 [Terrilactibacillus sp. BCM23-1]|uniref:Uncharacterized protein n=1 Tax=Terrilactibacillus tamarindi TaxID=2599694 RepID=A0A6N8CQ57_9BACI|nr:hypothetical protein [Terrilactibacillus tamarindi]MTT31780.1 hypothetical protein [Terrilactibacillus tamarindi]
MSIIDFEAAQKWSKLTKEVQNMFINNVFCFNCGETTIVDYSIINDEMGVVLTGKCKTCGENVTRLVEDI